MRTAIAAAAVLLVIVVTRPSRAADEGHAAPTAAPAAAAGAAHAAELPYSHPQLPPHPVTWPVAMLMAIAGLFAAAAVIGPIVRSEMHDELPPTHSHDEHTHGEHDRAHGGGGSGDHH